MSRYVAASHFQKSKTLNDKYLLGDELGKGAYGRVYKGVDLQNGDFVAIKQVSLENISQEDLSSITSEIDLLKNLNHKNIVKYLGSFKTKSHLYITLEFVENGSLASIIKPSKFGAFPESLVAVYIAQVLEGLVYLHEQGVIHRDIKGANILTTKEGLVKLADFGVATKLTDADGKIVVGTPYWMAPEVIEMLGVSAASDIWSVGCTVIELLTCVPPYYDLQPMSALYRIVQDEAPPLPDNLSADLVDFLLLCFQKDAKQRPDASSLLRHPWIRGSRISYVPEDASPVGERNMETTRLNGSPEIYSASPVPAVSPELSRSRTQDGSVGRSASETEIRSGEMSSVKGSSNLSLAARFSHAVPSSTAVPSHRRANSDDAAPRPPRLLSSGPAQQQAERQAGGASGSLEPSLIGEESLGLVWNSKGGRHRTTSSAERPIVNGGKFEEGIAGGRGGEYGGASVSRRVLEDSPGEAAPGHRRRNSVISVKETVVKPVKGTRSMSVPGKKTRRHSLEYDEAALADVVDAMPVEELTDTRDPPQVTGRRRGSLSRTTSLEAGASTRLLETAVGVDSPYPGRDGRARQSAEVARLLNEIRVQRSEEEVLQACHVLSEQLREEPEQKEQLIAHQGAIALTEILERANSNPKVLVAVLALVDQVMLGDVEVQESLCLLGLIPTVLTLASAERARPDLRVQVAQIVHQICQSSLLTLQMLISCRGLPILVGFLEPDFPKYRELVYMSLDCIARVLELQGPSRRNVFCRIFAKSGMLLRLVNVMHNMVSYRLDHDHLATPARWRPWGDMAMEPDLDVGNAQMGSNSSSHLSFLRIAESRENVSMTGHHLKAGGGGISVGSRRLIRSKSGNCTVISTSSSSSAGPEKSSRQDSSGASSRKGSDAPDVEHFYLNMAAGVLVEMARGDDLVKAQFCIQSMLKRLLDLLERLDAPVLVKVLRCIRQLTMDPHCLEPLQRAEAIKLLVPFLERREGQQLAEIHKQVLNALYNLCKVNKRRQELAAEAGIVPQLVHIVTTESPLNQFALPLLCEMAHASRVTREQLRLHGAIELYLVLLRIDEFWAPTALESLAVCLANDNEHRKVEQLLLRRDSLDRLVNFFQSCSGPAFVHISEPYLKMMTKSVRLNAALAVSGLTPLLVARLDHQDAIARLNLLKMIKAVYEHHPRPKQLVVEHDLPRKLQRLTEEQRDGERSGGQVLVKQMASTLLKGLHVNTLL